MIRPSISTLLLLSGMVIWTAQTAQAQLFKPRFTGRNSARNNTLDFLINRPTVSPYLNLTRNENINSGLPNYFSLVRPQLEQRRRSAFQRSRITQIQQQLNHVQSDVRQNRSNRGGIRTGHPTRFGVYLHYYPGLGR